MEKKNKTKVAKLHGKVYFGVLGSFMNEKDVQTKDCSKCRLHCNDSFTDVERKDILTLYYDLESYERQRDFVCRYVAQTPTSRGVTKQFARKYYLPKDGNCIQVCKFFLRTLGISQKTTEYAMAKQLGGVFAGKDGRGKHEPHNKTQETKLELVCAHIRSFQAVESH
jgi:hypothetical protein